MIAFPPCKINLGLRVIRKRDDGYHDIETCFYPLPFTDVLEIVPSEKFLFQQTGLTLPGNPDENLCIKAYYLLKDKFNLPEVAIYLHKLIPPGAGLGGGSSDAAWTLRLLHRVFSIPVSNEQLTALALQVGSDCPFFMYDVPMVGTGRGEVLQPFEISLKGYYLLLLKPEQNVSTAEAYSLLTPCAPDVPIEQLLKSNPEEWRATLINDFEQPVLRRYPVIGELKEALYRNGAIYASMTGSGSAVYGIFQNKPEVQADLVRYVVWEGEL